MRKKNGLFFCLGIMVTAILCCSGSAFGQNSGANPANKPPAQTPVVKQLKNLNQQRRQAAMNELSAVIEARMKIDPRYRAYIQSVDQHNKNAEAFAKAHKGGAR